MTIAVFLLHALREETKQAIEPVLSETSVSWTQCRFIVPRFSLAPESMTNGKLHERVYVMPTLKSFRRSNVNRYGCNAVCAEYGKVINIVSVTTV